MVDSPHETELEIDPAAVVIRFRPWQPEAVLRWAEKEHRRTGFYRVSVFAAAKEADETDDQLEQRLLKASALAGIVPSGNDTYAVCSAAQELMDLGLTFHKDGDEGEPQEHYSIDLGSQPGVPEVEQFLGAFPVRKGRK